jgi:DNA polymerase-1
MRLLDTHSKDVLPNKDWVLFDIETNGLLRGVSKLWCIVTYNPIDKFRRFTFHENNLLEGIEYIKQFSTWIGHNIAGYDIPALLKLKVILDEDIKPIIDTHVVSKLLYPAPDTTSLDKTLFKPIFDSGHGANGLKAWGKRLGEYKDDFGDTTDWSTPDIAMYDYCEQDVKVNLKLLQMLYNTTRWGDVIDAIHTETQMLNLLTTMTQTGVPIDMDKVILLKEKMEEDLKQAEANIPWYRQRCVTNISDTTGIINSVKLTAKQFNPNSTGASGDWLWLFNKLGVEPPQIKVWNKKLRQHEMKTTFSSKVIGDYAGIGIAPALKLLGIKKGYTTLYKGPKSIFNSTWNEDGKIHPELNPFGTVTYRCNHKNPNVNFPRVNKNKHTGEFVLGIEGGYGAEFRDLVGVPSTSTLIGVDAAALEMMCFGVVLEPFDAGEMLNDVQHGDPHTKAMEADNKIQSKWNVPIMDRGACKANTYGILYGGGNDKIGRMNGGDDKLGKELIDNRKKSWKGYLDLEQHLKLEMQENQGHIFSIDNRWIPVTSEHAVLNYKLQSTGSIIVKKAMLILTQELLDLGLEWVKDFTILLFVHDELQIECRKGVEDIIKPLAEKCFEKASIHYNLPCLIGGDIKEGKSWMETH